MGCRTPDFLPRISSRKIPLEPDGPLAIDLLEEAVRYQATRPRPASHCASNFTSGAEP
jgi:hypothetical protein